MKKIVFLLLIAIVAFKAVAQKADSVKNIVADSDSVYLAADTPPKFPGDSNAFNKYIHSVVHYPRTALMDKEQGKVFVQMIIEKDGSVSHVEIARKLFDDLDEEAVRVVKTSPKWIPATKDGKPVRMQIVRSVAFKFGPVTIAPTIYIRLQN